MYRPDNSSVATSKPTRGAVGPNPNGFYKTDTVVDSDQLTATTEEICNVIEGSGLTLNKEAGASPANDSQLYEAIVKMLKGTSTDIVNPFANYAHFRDEKPTGTVGGASTGGVKNNRDLTATSTNNIAGCSLNATNGLITLPTGTYRISASSTWSPVMNDNTTSVAKSFISDASGNDLITGNNSVFHSVDNGVTGDAIEVAAVRGTFTIATGTDVRIRTYTNSGGGFGGAVNLAGAVEVYSEIEIWKLD